MAVATIAGSTVNPRTVNPRLVQAVRPLINRRAKFEWLRNALVDLDSTLVAVWGEHITAYIPVEPSAELHTARPDGWQMIAIEEAQRSAWEYAHGDPDDAPRWPETAGVGVEIAELSPRDCTMLAHVASACAPDASRPVLCGVHLSQRNGRLDACAADGFRLHLATVGAVSGDTPALLLPQAAMVILGKLRRHTIVRAVLADDGHSISSVIMDALDAPDGPIMMRLVVQTMAGTFPDYRQVVPSDADAALIGETTASAVLEAAQAAMVCAKADERRGAGETNPRRWYQCPANGQYFNPTFVAGAVKGLPTTNDAVLLRSAGGGAPLRLDVPALEFTAVIMPIYLKP